MSRYHVQRTRGTIGPAANFNAERAAQKLNKAFRGIGTDERAIIEVITSHSNEQRQRVKQKYKTLFGSDLIEDLMSELGGNFEDVILALMKEPQDYIAENIYLAMKGTGTDEKTLIELLCYRTNPEIEVIKSTFKKKYNKNLEQELVSELSGDFRRLMRALLAAGREENVEVDFVQAQKDAQVLVDAGVGVKYGTDEAVFISLLNVRSYPQLRETFDAYKQISGKDIEESIDSEFSGGLRDGLLALVRAVKDPMAFYAQRLREAMKGSGTQDQVLIRILVSRSEIDLGDIKERYKQLHNTELGDAVADDTAGDYRKVLLKILNR